MKTAYHCHRCSGTGTIIVLENSPSGVQMNLDICPTCGGIDPRRHMDAPIRSIQREPKDETVESNQPKKKD